MNFIFYIAFLSTVFSFHFCTMSAQQTKELSSKWKPDFLLIENTDLLHKIDGGESIRRYASAMIDINSNENVFSICGGEKGTSLYIMLNEDYKHILTSILWDYNAKNNKKNEIISFLKWHKSTFSKTLLLVGNQLEPDDSNICLSLMD